MLAWFLWMFTQTKAYHFLLVIDQRPVGVPMSELAPLLPSVSCFQCMPTELDASFLVGQFQAPDEPFPFRHPTFFYSLLLQSCQCLHFSSVTVKLPLYPFRFSLWVSPHWKIGMRLTLSPSQMTTLMFISSIHHRWPGSSLPEIFIAPPSHEIAKIPLSVGFPQSHFLFCFPIQSMDIYWSRIKFGSWG